MNFNRFEHVNLNVQNLEDSKRFYQTLFPDWYVRAEGTNQGCRWLHFGNGQFYLALNDSPGATRTHSPYEGIGINHIGFVITDAEKMRSLLEHNGIEYYTGESPETKARLYINDPDGNEIELVEYQPDYALR
ncbi:lactoylglutathione lyase-like lyase [Leptolyngbyaceae cyanobacterium JSC-12]|nr:lactoylglutathione lyase-like lyase [Leptolyngbyaceae cyanobacterium JSC-12]